ncbi:putative uncharacterized protein [Bacteroides sp. CAG:462]|nr:putative uncharacterized protein [Bacteroides sp. CAG:462]
MKIPESLLLHIILAALFLLAAVIGLMRPLRNRTANFCLFVAGMGLETMLAYRLLSGQWLLPALVSAVFYYGREFFATIRRHGSSSADAIRLPVKSGYSGSHLKFFYPFSNFLVYGGAGSGKTKSVGKWLLEEYIRQGFAGFIYDFKDVDYTRTAYNLMLKHGYPHKFYYINFDNPARSYRFNPLKAVQDEAELMQLMEDMLRAFLPPKSEENEWFTGALGILRGVAFRLWDEYRRYCTIPHIVLLIMDASLEELQSFLQRNSLSSMMAGAYLKAAGSEKTQASYISTLCNYLSTFAADKNLAYVLSGDEFDFNLIDPENPKMFAVSNNFTKNSIYAPVIGMLMSISSRQFSMQNRVPFVYFLDEMTTVKVRDFEGLPSVLREYKAAFVLLTQSGAKVEKLYGKNDRSSIEANFGNVFFGRTTDVEALKYYPTFFGKAEKERKSRSSGTSGRSSNKSVTISTAKEDIYQGRDFSALEPGEFIGFANRANIKEFKVKLKMFQIEERDLPIVRTIKPNEIAANQGKILQEVRDILSGVITSS